VRTQSDEQVPLELGDELKDFQALDVNHDGMLSPMELLAFILHHMNARRTSSHVVALCKWIDRSSRVEKLIRSSNSAASAQPRKDAHAARTKVPSRWVEHIDESSGRPYYSNPEGKVRWEPPPDLIPCPFDGGQWTYVAGGGHETSAPVSFSELWSGAADGTIAEDSMVGLDSIPDQYWPLTSIFSRAIAVAKVFDKADADHSGTLSSKEFITWLRAQSDETIPLELGDELKDFQALDANNDGMLSHVEFLAFILHHMNSKVMSPHVVALCHWIDGNLSRNSSPGGSSAQTVQRRSSA
jgi:Ca2+-binding EF-hand superfamily protein